MTMSEPIYEFTYDHTFDGFTVTVCAYVDTYTDPKQFDGISSELLERWQNDEWHFIDVLVTASLDGYELGSAIIGGTSWIDESLGALVTETCDAHGLISEAVNDANQSANRLAKRLSER